jgi:hypothetical protein
MSHLGREVGRTVRYALVSNARTARLITLMLATTVTWYICGLLTR